MPDESDPSFSPTRWRIDVETRLSRLEDAREPEKLDETLQLMNHPDDGVIVRLDRLQQIAIQNEKNEKAREAREAAEASKSK